MHSSPIIKLKPIDTKSVPMIGRKTIKEYPHHKPNYHSIYPQYHIICPITTLCALSTIVSALSQTCKESKHFLIGIFMV